MVAKSFRRRLVYRSLFKTGELVYPITYLFQIEPDGLCSMMINHYRKAYHSVFLEFKINEGYGCFEGCLFPQIFYGAFTTIIV